VARQELCHGLLICFGRTPKAEDECGVATLTVLFRVSGLNLAFLLDTEAMLRPRARSAGLLDGTRSEARVKLRPSRTMCEARSSSIPRRWLVVVDSDTLITFINVIETQEE